MGRDLVLGRVLSAFHKLELPHAHDPASITQPGPHPRAEGGNILCQGVNSKYFQLCGQSLPRVVKAPKDAT